MTTKVGIAEILQAKKVIEAVKNTDFYSETFGGEIEIENISPQKIVEIVNNSSEEEPLRSNYELIYACCPIFRNVELQNEFEVKDPIDIVEKAFGGNVFEIDALAKHILRRYGYKLEGDVEKIKKQ